jgi:protein-disulfide isomerase
MQAKNALIAALVLAAMSCGQPKDKKGEPIAKVGKETITTADLQKEVGSQLEQMEAQYQQQVYQFKKQQLEKLVSDRMFAAKAKEAGLPSAEAFVRKMIDEIVAKVPDPTDADVHSEYDKAKASGQQLPPFEEMRARIATYIKQQKAQPELMAYYEGLKKEMGVEMFLPPYLPPRKTVEAKGPSRGEKNAPITIVEFSDFQCPYCVRAEPTVAQLVAAYPGKIRVVYRDYPLPIHPLAPKAAEASHCADDQGKYWEMHDKLFSVDGKLEVENLKKYARDLGLNGDNFDKCLDSGEKAKVVAEHQKAAEGLGVTSTPAFFINGRLVSGAVPLEDFKVVVEAELKGTK